MALDNVTSHFSTMLEPIASASFLSSLSMIGIFGYDHARNNAPFVARSLTPVPRSLLLNRTETLAAQAIVILLRVLGNCRSDRPRYKNSEKWLQKLTRNSPKYVYKSQFYL